MKYVELFAGVGGFRAGIERAFNLRRLQHDIPKGPESRDDLTDELEQRKQPTCVFANEWDKYAAQTYNKNFGGQIDQRDITTIPTSDIPDHGLLVGGFPCQAFSVAGKRLGFNETRGTLFFEIARILADKKPQHLLLENVKGLLSHDSGRTFQTILGVLADLGYRVEWQVLNSKDFGVPQNRERVLIVGHLGACCGRQVFPIAPDSSTAAYLPTLTARYYGAQATGGYIGHKDGNEGGEATISSRQTSGQEQAEPDANEQRRRPEATPHIRRLTPIECERLQGFPDNWTAGVSDTQRYKQMGNAVTVNVIEAVIRRLYD